MEPHFTVLLTVRQEIKKSTSKTRQYEEYKFRVMIPYSLVGRCTGAKFSNETATSLFFAAE
jgi:hypothetical protein